MRIEERYIEEIGRALAEQHAAVMVGAGFSKNAEKISMTGCEFLNWNQLTDLFYERLYGDSEIPGKNYSNSLRLAEEVEIMIGRPALEKLIKEAVPDEDYAPSELFRQLMELPWKDVFTTNYDTLLERTADLITGRRYNVVVCKEDLVNSGDASRIVKLHGSFPSQRPFIITEEDYRTYPVKFAPMVNTVQQALLENVFCLLGFSCEDPNFISWIGWIHDHLSKSSSQKMYMIAVTHVPEAQKKLYFEKNIIIVDLQELWQEKSIPERLEAFFEKLKEKVAEKEVRSKWFDWGELQFGRESSYSQKAENMKKIRLSYPGWIFLPWDLKKKTAYMLYDLEMLAGFDKIPFSEQLDYMFEYVKLFDIAGRPLLAQTAALFWRILTESDGKEQPVMEAVYKEMCQKEQSVYLHLLRTYRELADWERFQACRLRIKEELLCYEEKQFLYAEECRRDLFCFDARRLAERLEAWSISEGDEYWPLIKAHLFVAIGESSKADDILMKNLASVRKQLAKDAGNVYLVSVEESCVSLLNYIRQGNIAGENKKLERCIHAGSFSWWDENEKYCLNLKAELREIKTREVKYMYNLGQTYTMHYGRDNDDIFIAMEYWRFFEKTGHMFRIGNVTCKEGLEGSVKRLCRYYPYWSLMQILTARETKYVDDLFGRAALAGLTMEEADGEAGEYLKLFQTVMEYAKTENRLWPKSVYEQAAGVLPEILAHFSYKCSVNMLDEMLELLLTLCLSNKQMQFEGLSGMLRGVIGGYSVREQGERINKILIFPMVSEQMSKYRDPVNYLKPPKKKYRLEMDMYHRVMLRLRQELTAKEPEVRADALNRFIVLQQIIVLEKEDKKYLFRLLEEETDLRDSYLLYVLNGKNQKYLERIVKETYDRMKTDTSESHFSARGSEYAELLWVSDEVCFMDYGIAEWFVTLGELLKATAHWLDNGAGARERIRQSCIIAQGILLSLQKQKAYRMDREEEEAFARFLDAAKAVYGDTLSFEIAACGLTEAKVPDWLKLERDLWTCRIESIELLHSLMQRMIRNRKELSENKFRARCTEKVTEVFAARLVHAQPEEERELLEFFAIMINYIPLSEHVMSLLNLKLELLLKETEPEKEDTEERAIKRLRSRIAACELAASFERAGIQSEAVSGWKAVREDPNEFVEVRQV